MVVKGEICTDEGLHGRNKAGSVGIKDRNSGVDREGNEKGDGEHVAGDGAKFSGSGIGIGEWYLVQEHACLQHWFLPPNYHVIFAGLLPAM